MQSLGKNVSYFNVEKVRVLNLQPDYRPTIAFQHLIKTAFPVPLILLPTEPIGPPERWQTPDPIVAHPR